VGRVATLFMEYGQDFKLNGSGGLAMALAFDETRQILERAAFTTAALTLPDGSIMEPEYFLDPTFGESLKAKVGTLATRAALDEIQRGLRAAASAAPGVNINAPPTFVIQQVGNTVNVFITIYLSNGTSQQLAYSIG
jgi:hypothetical protein